MEKDEIKQAVKEAIKEFLESPEGETQVGNIALKAISIGLSVDLDISEFDREKLTHVVTKKRVNVLHFLAKYLPQIEGRLAGVQEDANKTFNTIGRIAKASIAQKKKRFLQWR
jgi:hypothetical protein